ncbi:MAG: methyltransferase domain-containing protein, partial [Lapillicoccus sp.]
MAEERRATGRGGASSLRTHAVSSAVGELVRAQSAQLGRPLQVLDLGGGTGGLAVPLAELGHSITVVDPSP